MDTYSEFRKHFWNKQLPYNDDLDFRRSEYKGKKIRNGCYFEPKKILFWKDTFHCGSLREAKKLLRKIAKYKDVTYLELKGTWLSVDYEPCLDHELPGQVLDDRKTVRGR